LFFTIEVERPRGTGPTDPEKQSLGPFLRDRNMRSVMSLGIGLLGVTAAVVGGWTLAGGTIPISAADLFSLGTSVGSEGRGAAAQLKMAIELPFATVYSDGQKRGQTPIPLALSTGSHDLRLTTPPAVDNERVADLSGDTQLDIAMLMRRPTAVQLK